MPFEPIGLTPKAIRQAFADRLAEVAVAPLVKQNMARPFSASEAAPAALNVFSPGSDGLGATPGIVARFETTFRVVVAGTVVLPEGFAFTDTDRELGDRLDDLELAIKQAILGSRKVIGSFRRLAHLKVDKGVEAKGTDFRGYVYVEFGVVYNEQFDYVDVTPLPWLEEVRIDVRPAGAAYDCLVTDAGEHLITGEGECFNVGTPAIDLRPIFRVRLVTDEGDSLVTDESDNLVTDGSYGFEVAA